MRVSLPQTTWTEISTVRKMIQNVSNFDILIQIGSTPPEINTGLVLEKSEVVEIDPKGAKIYGYAIGPDCEVESIDIEKGNFESKVSGSESWVELPKNITGLDAIIDCSDSCVAKIVGTQDRANLDGSPIEIDLTEAVSNTKAKIAAGRFAAIRMEITTSNAIPEVKSSLSTDLTGANNDLDYTAKGVGVAGDDVSIEYSDPAIESASLEVAVDEKKITVHLATNDQNGGEIITTADEIKAAIALVPAAVALITVADKAGNDGSGVVIAMAKTNLAGGVNPVAATKPVLTVIAG